jgi:3-deoxy-manno-octulosonate cytidylyltransferase (CMP-KDO synthetase)
MKVLGVIPARYASERFPGKPLALIAGKPMVQWVYEAAKKALPRVIVATDDSRILKCIEGLGGEALLTSPSCRSGTDRVAEVARRVRADIYLNIQGDEPLMSARTIKRVVALHADSRVAMGTGATVLSPRDWPSPDVVKVLVDKKGDALLFSRAPLPFVRDAAPGTVSPDFPPIASGKLSGTAACVYKHLGLYSYRADFLKQFVRWSPCFLETSEKLEQLRALQNGIRIRVAFTPDDSVGVDRPADVRHVEKRIKKRS